MRTQEAPSSRGPETLSSWAAAHPCINHSALNTTHSQEYLKVGMIVSKMLMKEASNKICSNPRGPLLESFSALLIS